MKLHEAMTGWLVAELQQRTGFVWDSNVARYRSNATGRFVAERDVISVAEKFAAYSQNNMTNITQRYIDGKIGLTDWQRLMRQEVKDNHLVSAMAGRGGRAAMTQSDWGRTGARLRTQYGHLDNLAWERFNGTVSDAQLMARAKMYANASRTSYYDGQTAANKAAGFDEERRVLNPAEHCLDCIGFAGLGWQPIGTLPEPGQQSVCRSNCKCTKEYRVRPEEEELIPLDYQNQQTIKDVEKWLRDSNIFTQGSVIDLSEVKDIKIANKIAVEYTKLYNQYRDNPKIFGGISVVSPNELGMAAADSTFGHIRLNSAYWKDVESYRAWVNKTAQGQFVSNAPGSVLRHEFAHSIDLANRNPEIDKEISDLFNNWIQKQDVNNPLLSRYALSSEKEMIAEAYVSWTLTPVKRDYELEKIGLNRLVELFKSWR